MADARRGPAQRESARSSRSGCPAVRRVRPALRDVSRARWPARAVLPGLDLPRLRLRTRRGPSFFCEPCRAQRCPECKVYAGRHGPRCRYLERRRRPPLTVYGVVDADEMIALFNECHKPAVVAARFAGELTRPDAEDVVSTVFLWMWQHRDCLNPLTLRAYLFAAVRNGARRKHLYAWARFVVAMDPATLVVAEQMAYDRTGATLAVPV